MNDFFARTITAPTFYADGFCRCDPLFTQLRRESPLSWVEPEGFRPFWIVTKRADIVEIERQHDKFINEPRLNLNPVEEEERVRAGTGRGTPNPVRMLVNMDEPDHRLHRAITQSWFLPLNLSRLDGAIAALAREFVDKLQGLDGACDFNSDIAVWYPLRVIMTILGVPPEDDRTMLRFTQAIFASDDPQINMGRPPVEVRQEAIQGFFRYFSALAAHRRQAPSEDLGSVIANARINGEPLSDYETLSYYMIVATAGHDTTSATISGGLLALLENPEQMAKLRADPELLGSAVDEMLRWVTPVTHFFRTATQDYELRGQQIKSGQSLMLCYRSGNRDEEVFDDPFRFQIDRKANQHISFGHGVHTCLGMHLAKLEIKALFRELLSRTETLELASEPEFMVGRLIAGLQKLPLRCNFKQTTLD